ncbi:MAG: DUF4390 domain-containing protein [Woeseia sp.]
MTGKLTGGLVLILIGSLITTPMPAEAQEGPDRAGYFDVRSASTALVEGVHVLESRLQLVLSDEALDALASGVALRIELKLEVIRIRRFIPDSTDAELVVSYELEYRPLSQRYIVRNLNSGDQDSFATLYSALNNLGRIQGLPVIDDAILEADKRYRIRLRARLSTEQYPAPLRILFFWRDQWQLESEWFEWLLER